MPLRLGVACHGGVPGGGPAFHRCEGRPRSGAPLHPAARPPGGLSGPTIHVLWAWVFGCGGPALSPWLACPAGAACRGGGGGLSPGGVACHRCEGRLVSGAVPPPAIRPLGRAAGAPRPVCTGCGWRGRGDPAMAPLRAPLRAGVAGCGGGGRASPRRLRSGAPPPPTALSASATDVLWVRVCGCGGPALSPWLAPLLGAACRGGGGGPSPGGPACHRCEGRLVSGAVRLSVACPLGRAARVPRPMCPVCGWCGGGDPPPAPQRVRPCGLALLAVEVAEGRPRAGGALHRCEGSVRSGASPPPTPCPRAGCRGPPPTCCGRGCAGVGAQLCPLGSHALWGLRAAGLLGGRPRGRWPAMVVRGVWCQALSLPRPPVLWGGWPGFRNPYVPGAVGAGVGTQHQPHSVCPCGPALRAVGVAEGRPRGGCLLRS